MRNWKERRAARKRRLGSTRVTNGLLIALLVIFGLGALTYTAKALDDKYGWVEKFKSHLVIDVEADDTEEEILTEDETSEETSVEESTEA